jgi:hypothetical protein
MLFNQEIAMLAALLSGILEGYVEYKAKKTWVAYAARFFAFLAMTLLIVTNYIYFTVPEKTIFSLIATACCFVISVMLFCINFYIKKRRKHEFIKPFLDKIHLLENILEKLLLKGKVLNNYRTITILGITGIIVLIIRRYLRKG